MGDGELLPRGFVRVSSLWLFSSGDGVDNDSNVLSAQKLMDTIMVPRFKNGEVGPAIYAGARACATQVYSIANLESPKDIADDRFREATGRRNINV